MQPDRTAPLSPTVPVAAAGAAPATQPAPGAVVGAAPAAAAPIGVATRPPGGTAPAAVAAPAAAASDAVVVVQQHHDTAAPIPGLYCGGVESTVFTEAAKRNPWPTNPQRTKWVCPNCGAGNGTVWTDGASAQLWCHNCGEGALCLNPDKVPADEDALRSAWTRSTGNDRCEVCSEVIVPGGFTSGKHHCRDCGKLVCDKCSEPGRKRCAGYGQFLRRVCNECYDGFLSENVVLKITAGSQNSVHKSLVTLLDFWVGVRHSSHVTILVDLHYDAQRPAQLSVLPDSRRGKDWSCTSIETMRALNERIGAGIRTRMEQMRWRPDPALFEQCTLDPKLTVRVVLSAPTELVQKELRLVAQLISELILAEFGGAVDVVDPEVVEVDQCPQEGCGTVLWWEKGKKPGRCGACGKKAERQEPTSLSWIVASVWGAQPGTYFAVQYRMTSREPFENMHLVCQDGVITEPEGFLQLRKAIGDKIRRRQQIEHAARGRGEHDLRQSLVAGIAREREIQQQRAARMEAKVADAEAELGRVRQEVAMSAAELSRMREESVAAAVRAQESREEWDKRIRETEEEHKRKVQEAEDELQKAQDHKMKLNTELEREKERHCKCSLCYEADLDCFLGCGHTYCWRCIAKMVHAPLTETPVETKVAVERLQAHIQASEQCFSCPNCRAQISAVHVLVLVVADL